MEFNALTTIAGIGFLAAIAQWVAWRVRLPAILFLLLFGILVGPVLSWLHPDDLFGELLFPVISLSVAVILFEGSMTLRFSELKEVGSTVRNLVTIGALVTWAITSWLVHTVIGFEYKLAFLFGAVVVVTGPTVIVPMLRTVRPNKRIANILRWEGIIIDPLGALLAVLAFDFYISTQAGDAAGSILLLFLKIVLAGVILGYLAGVGLGTMLKRYLMPEYLRSPITLLLVFIVFAVSEQFEHESGLLAVTIFGMTLANQKDLEVDDILDFKESLTIVLIGGLFVILAARVDLNALLNIGVDSLILLAGVMFIARPVSVFISSFGSELTIQERLLIAWIGPRGIVCAAVASVFAIRLVEIGAEDAEIFVPLAFLIIIGTVVLQSTTAKYVAHWLGVRDPAPSGFLIVGGSRVGRMLAEALHEQDLRVLVADSDWENISQARMGGVETYYGNPVSEHADRYMDLSGIGNLISLTGRTNFDVVASMHFRSIFGARNAYELPSAAEGEKMDKHRISARLRGQRMFGEDVTYNMLLGWLTAGASVRVTALSEEFGFEEYVETYADRFITLFAVDTSDRLHVETTQSNLKPEAGWKLISLVKPENEDR
ncbi:MAG: sodium:proton antiporter [Gammaproteobacteria bacterium]|nr:sodium:proton antiporter [Gammaproteobacteria bacterium]